MPDIALGRALESTTGWTVEYASYASGALACRHAGVPLLDLDLPAHASYTMSLARCVDLLETAQPECIVVHEEFAALVAAALLGIPAIYIADWLPAQGTLGAEALALADAILVFERPGVFAPPHPLKAAPRFLGPLARSLPAAAGTRAAVRAALGIAADGFLVVVCPGGDVTEETAPLAPLVLPAFDALADGRKNLLWVAGQDYDHLVRATSELPAVRVLRFTDEILRLLLAADVVITRGTRVTTVEAASLGTPTIAISHRRNSMDDFLGARIQSNLQLHAGSMDADILHRYLEEIRRSHPRGVRPAHFVDEHHVASILREVAGRLVAGRPAAVAVA